MFKKLLEKDIETNEMKFTPITVISISAFVLTMMSGYFFMDDSYGLDLFYYNFAFWIGLAVSSMTFSLTLSFKKETKKSNLIFMRGVFAVMCCVFIVPVYQSIKDMQYISNPEVVILEKYEIKKEKVKNRTEYKLEGININSSKNFETYLSKKELMLFKQFYKSPVKITLLPNTRTILGIDKYR